LREEAVSSSADDCPASVQATFAAGARRSPRKFWPSVIRIAIAEVVLLFALASVFVAYLNWSSEATFAEFLAASEADFTSVAVITPASDSDLAGERCDRPSGLRP
jgi:hypothetical protein